MLYNDGGGNDAGHARVFAWDSDENEWKQRGDDIDGEAADDLSGFSVSLSADGTALAVGASYNDDAGSNAGSTRVYSTSALAGGDADGGDAGEFGQGDGDLVASGDDCAAICARQRRRLRFGSFHAVDGCAC